MWGLFALNKIENIEESKKFYSSDTVKTILF